MFRPLGLDLGEMAVMAGGILDKVCSDVMKEA